MADFSGHYRLFLRHDPTKAIIFHRVKILQFFDEHVKLDQSRSNRLGTSQFWVTWHFFRGRHYDLHNLSRSCLLPKKNGSGTLTGPHVACWRIFDPLSQSLFIWNSRIRTRRLTLSLRPLVQHLPSLHFYSAHTLHSESHEARSGVLCTYEGFPDKWCFNIISMFQIFEVGLQVLQDLQVEEVQPQKMDILCFVVALVLMLSKWAHCL